MQIVRGEERHFRAQLKIRQRTILNSTSSYPPEQSKIRADGAREWTVRWSFGYKKTLNKIWQKFYWLRARTDIDKWCRVCGTCAASRGPWTRNRGQMHQYNVGAPFERIIDVAVSFPGSNQGNRYLLFTMDYFTKWPEAYAIPNQEASTIAEALVTDFFCRFGIPWESHSDQSRNFEFLQRLELSRTRTTPLHPQSDSMVERHIKTGRTRAEGRRISPKGLGREITPLSPSLPGLHSRHHGLDSNPPIVRVRTPTTLRPTIWGTPRQGMTHNRSRGRLSGTPTRHPQLCPPTPEASDWIINR
jgi:hypothetical protein